MDKEEQSLQSVRRLAIIAAATLTLVFYPVSRATPDADERLSLIFLGDTNFGESYLEEVEKNGGENILKSRGYGYSINHFSNDFQGDRVADRDQANTLTTDPPTAGQSPAQVPHHYENDRH